MWITKIILKHDCILGNRCKKYNVTLQSIDFTNKKEESGIYEVSSVHQMIGDEKNIKKFVADLKKDPKTDHIERAENTLFLIEKQKQKPVGELRTDIFFLRPVIIDNNGIETFEMGSHKKEYLMRYINIVRPMCSKFEVKYLKKTPLKNVYFPKIMPDLTDIQKKALELAIREGYYNTPRQTDLRKLAKIMKVSSSTYQEHLQKAESKIMADIMSYLK